jgi:hypothetical protein
VEPVPETTWPLEFRTVWLIVLGEYRARRRDLAEQVVGVRGRRHRRNDAYVLEWMSAI